MLFKFAPVLCDANGSWSRRSARIGLKFCGSSFLNMILMMAAEGFEKIFVVLDGVSLDESRKVALLIRSLIAREARDKKQLGDAFFI